MEDKESRGLTKGRLFLRASAGDFLLVFAASVGLVLTVSFGFESAPVMRGNVFVVTLAVLPMLAVLYAGSWSKQAAALSAVGAVAYAAIVLGVCVAAQPYSVELFTGGVINDDPQSYVIFGIVLVAVPVLAYLLSRRRVGAVVLLVGAIVACGAIHLLYPDWARGNGGVASSAVVLVSCGALLVFQRYRSCAYQVQHLESTAFGSAFAYSLVTSAACFGVGAAVFAAVIAPLGLQTVELRPFADYFYRPVVEYTGVYDVSQVEDPDALTSATNDQVAYTNEEAPGGAESQSPDETGAMGTNAVAAALQQMASFDITSWLQEFMAISYERFRSGALLVVLAVVAFLVAAAFLQRYLRARRIAKLEELPLEERIGGLYAYLCKRMARLGLGRPASMTPLEYAFAATSSLPQFAQDTGGADFVDVTLAYQRACLDEGRATQGDWDLMKRFYRPFFRNARAQVGRLRWLRYFWRM